MAIKQNAVAELRRLVDGSEDTQLRLEEELGAVREEVEMAAVQLRLHGFSAGRNTNEPSSELASDGEKT